MQSDCPQTNLHSRFSRPSGCIGSTSVILAAAWLLMAGGAEARTWSDATGSYTIEADFLTANDDYVVLRNEANELIMAPIAQLASKDVQYVEQQIEERRQQTTAEDQTTSETSSDDDASTPATSKTDSEEGSQPDPPTDFQVDPRTASEAEFDSTWKIKGSTDLMGRLIGFGTQRLTVRLRESEILVNGQPIAELPPAYQATIPHAAAQATTRPVDSFKQIVDLLTAGGGSLNVVVEGVQLKLVSGEVITVPPALLTEEDAKLVTPSFQRWKAAQQSTVTDDVREEVDRRERLMMDSYASYRGGVAEPPRKLTMLQMQLEAADAGVTDMWEVALYPPNAHEYPRTVIVAGENSRIARIRAKRDFPDWRVGPVRKRSY